MPSANETDVAFCIGRRGVNARPELNQPCNNTVIIIIPCLQFRQFLGKSVLAFDKAKLVWVKKNATNKEEQRLV